MRLLEARIRGAAITLAAFLAFGLQGCREYQKQRAWYLLEHPAELTSSQYFVPLAVVVVAVLIAIVVAVVVLARKR